MYLHIYIHKSISISISKGIENWTEPWGNSRVRAIYNDLYISFSKEIVFKDLHDVGDQFYSF